MTPLWLRCSKPIAKDLTMRFICTVNLVAADVRRLHLFREISQSLLTSAATVQGLTARTAIRRILTVKPKRRHVSALQKSSRHF